MDKEMWDKLMNTNWWEKFVKFVFVGLKKVLILLTSLVYRIQAFAKSGEWTKKHFTFVKDGNKYKLIIKSHDDFVEDVEIEIAKYKGRRWGKKFIEYILELSLTGCNFVIFECDNVFVQFWTGRGKLEMDIPLVKGNGLRKYYYTVIGLLTDMNYFKYPFTRTGIPTFLKIPEHFTFRVDEGEGFTKVVGFFDKRTDQAVEFVDRLFREVYEVKKRVFEITIG